MKRYTSTYFIIITLYACNQLQPCERIVTEEYVYSAYEGSLKISALRHTIITTILNGEDTLSMKDFYDGDFEKELIYKQSPTQHDDSIFWQTEQGKRQLFKLYQQRGDTLIFRLLIGGGGYKKWGKYETDLNEKALYYAHAGIVNEKDSLNTNTVFSNYYYSLDSTQLFIERNFRKEKPVAPKGNPLENDWQKDSIFLAYTKNKQIASKKQGYQFIAYYYDENQNIVCISKKCNEKPLMDIFYTYDAHKNLKERHIWGYEDAILSMDDGNYPVNKNGKDEIPLERQYFFESMNIPEDSYKKGHYWFSYEYDSQNRLVEASLFEEGKLIACKTIVYSKCFLP